MEMTPLTIDLESGNLPRVEVTVRLHGQVVEQRCFRFNHHLSIGEGPDSKLILPCSPIDLSRDGDAVRVRGVRLLANDSLSVRMDAQNQLCPLGRKPRHAGGLRAGGDGRFAVTLLIAACVWPGRMMRLQFQIRSSPLRNLGRICVGKQRDK